jgi:hypothetical protein
MKVIHRSRKGFRLATLLLSLCVAIAMAHNAATAQTWVASTGTGDGASLSTYQFVNGAAFVRASVARGTVILRYNVLPVGDLLVPVTEPCCESRALWVRFLDNGKGAQVLVTLKRYNVLTGQITTLLTFDSKKFPSQSTFQAPLPTIDDGSLINFSFASGPVNGNNQGGDSVYFIEATLIRSAPGGNPGLASVSIVRSLAP